MVEDAYVPGEEVIYVSVGGAISEHMRVVSVSDPHDVNGECVLVDVAGNEDSYWVGNVYRDTPNVRLMASTAASCFSLLDRRHVNHMLDRRFDPMFVELLDASQLLFRTATDAAGLEHPYRRALFRGLMNDKAVSRAQTLLKEFAFSAVRPCACPNCNCSRPIPVEYQPVCASCAAGNHFNDDWIVP